MADGPVLECQDGSVYMRNVGYALHAQGSRSMVPKFVDIAYGVRSSLDEQRQTASAPCSYGLSGRLCTGNRAVLDGLKALEIHYQAKAACSWPDMSGSDSSRHPYTTSEVFANIKGDTRGGSATSNAGSPQRAAIR